MSRIEDRILYSKEPYTLDPGDDLYIYRLLDMVQEELRDTGDRDWIIDAAEEKSIRLSHLKGRSLKVASGLTALGFKEGDILHCAYSTNIDFYWPVFGAWLCGGVASVADPGLSVENCISQIQDTKCRIIVCSKVCSSKYVQANNTLPLLDQAKHILVLDQDPWENITTGATSFRALYNDPGTSCPTTSSLSPYDPKAGTLVNWTSGTTGAPKGVLFSQEFMHFMLRKSAVPPNSMALTTNIMFHGGGFQLALDGGIRNRFTVVFIKAEDFSAAAVFNAIQKYCPIFYMCGASEFTMLAGEEEAGHDLGSLKAIMPCGARVSNTALQRFREKCPGLLCLQFYGSTEVGGVSGSVGQVDRLGSLRQGVAVYIRDQNTDARLGVGEVGEIMARTPTVMKTFINRDEDLASVFDGEGFAHMGDLGYYDENGVLYFKERMKELMKLGNTWVGPGEIEDVLEDINGVVEAVVWQMENRKTNHFLTHAGVVTRPTCQLTAEQVKKMANNKLEEVKRITGQVHIMESIPHNPQGKKLRLQVRRKFDQ